MALKLTLWFQFVIWLKRTRRLNFLDISYHRQTHCWQDPRGKNYRKVPAIMCFQSSSLFINFLFTRKAKQELKAFNWNSEVSFGRFFDLKHVHLILIFWLVFMLLQHFKVVVFYTFWDKIFVFNLISFLSVGVPIIVLVLIGEPYKRGFFCDDESLMHPYHKSTVKHWMLYVFGLVMPISVVSINQHKLSSSWFRSSSCNDARDSFNKIIFSLTQNHLFAFQSAS